MIVFLLFALVCMIPTAMAITRLRRAFRDGGAKDRSGETYTRVQQPVQFWFLISAYVLVLLLFGGGVVWLVRLALEASK